LSLILTRFCAIEREIREHTHPSDKDLGPDERGADFVAASQRIPKSRSLGSPPQRRIPVAGDPDSMLRWG